MASVHTRHICVCTWMSKVAGAMMQVGGGSASVAGGGDGGGDDPGRKRPWKETFTEVPTFDVEESDEDSEEEETYSAEGHSTRRPHWKDTRCAHINSAASSAGGPVHILHIHMRKNTHSIIHMCLAGWRRAYT